MTQELIANMFGVRREGVTEATGKLHKFGVIRYVRGQITVLDRPKLEQLCCECYAVNRSPAVASSPERASSAKLIPLSVRRYAASAQSS
jgi:Crp-like helix-turn-helix protein